MIVYGLIVGGAAGIVISLVLVIISLTLGCYP